MKKLAIISFDICRPEEPQTAFAIGSILSALKGHEAYGDRFEVYHFGYNLYSNPRKEFIWESEPIVWDQFESIAIGCYIWSHPQVLSLMAWIKINYPRIRIIAGGYQINSQNKGYLKSLYPNADQFILGHAELALVKIMTEDSTPSILQVEPDWENLPSPFLTKEISITEGVCTLRMETKRGCPYACTFCAQHELGKTKTHFYSGQRISRELEFISSLGIKRVSVTDPVFNMGNTYHQVLRTIKDSHMDGVFNFQVRPELISRMGDFEFLDLIQSTQSEIELGLQTFDPRVNELIKRKNQYEYIDQTIKLLIERQIHFGISLIYGLPGQTLDSFKKDIETSEKLGIQNVVAFPLMLLPGTELYMLKETEGVIERPLGEYQIPHIVSGPGFTEKEWEDMHDLAQLLNKNGRLF